MLIPCPHTHPVYPAFRLSLWDLYTSCTLRLCSHGWRHTRSSWKKWAPPRTTPRWQTFQSTSSLRYEHQDISALVSVHSHATHAAGQMLGGHPQAIADAAALLADKPMDQVVEQVRITAGATGRPAGITVRYQAHANQTNTTPHLQPVLVTPHTPAHVLVQHQGWSTLR